MFTSTTTLLFLLLSPLTFALIPNGRSIKLSQHKRMVRRPTHARLAKRSSSATEAVLQCDGQGAFKLCYPGFVNCSVSQPVAQGTACIDGAIAMAPAAGAAVAQATSTDSTEDDSTADDSTDSGSDDSEDSTSMASESATLREIQPTTIEGASPKTSVAPAVETAASAPAVALLAKLATPTPTIAPIVATPPPASSPAAPSSSSSTTFFGKGTFFFQEGAFGACGKIHADSVPLVALASARFGTGSNQAPDCGRNVKITNTANGKQVSAVVADSCPGCSSFDSLDLSTGAFDAIADEATGVINISWEFTS